MEPTGVKLVSDIKPLKADEWFSKTAPSDRKFVSVKPRRTRDVVPDEVTKRIVEDHKRRVALKTANSSTKSTKTVVKPSLLSLIPATAQSKQPVVVTENIRPLSINDIKTNSVKSNSVSQSNPVSTDHSSTPVKTAINGQSLAFFAPITPGAKTSPSTPIVTTPIFIPNTTPGSTPSSTPVSTPIFVLSSDSKPINRVLFPSSK